MLNSDQVILSKDTQLDIISSMGQTEFKNINNSKLPPYKLMVDYKN